MKTNRIYIIIALIVVLILSVSLITRPLTAHGAFNFKVPNPYTDKALTGTSTSKIKKHSILRVKKITFPIYQNKHDNKIKP